MTFDGRLSWLTPYDPLRLDRLQRLGLRNIQLRLGPEFPLPPASTPDAEFVAAGEQVARRGMSIGAIGFYRNMLHPDPAQRQQESDGLLSVMEVAGLLGVGTISVFCGRDPERTWEESLPAIADVWTPLAEEAAARGLRLAMENCTMFRGYPVRGINATHCPAAYREVFRLVPSAALGMEFDPSHCIKQRIDPVRMAREFAPRIFHVHLKDHEVLEESVYEYGSYDARSSRDRFPGFGSVDWKGLFDVLTKSGYDGLFTVEGENEPLVQGPDDLEPTMAASIGKLKAAWRLTT
jgi:sugar phosphate isomerase/epimerase